MGSVLAEQLLKNNFKVIGIDRERKSFLHDEIFDNENFTFLKADINVNFSDILKGSHIDGIFHLASQQPSCRDLTYENFYKGNVETMLNVINLSKEKKVQFVAYTSTTAVFGKQPEQGHINEEVIPGPADYYGLTKYIAEGLLEVGLKDERTKGIVMRFPSLFGKNHLGGLVYTYYELARTGQDIEVYSKGERYKNLLCENDAGKILLSVIANVDRLGKFEIFTAGSKNSLRTKEIAQIVKKLLNSDSKINPVDKCSSTEKDVFIDISKAQDMLNFDPSTIQEGLRLYIEEMMKNEV